VEAEAMAKKKKRKVGNTAARTMAWLRDKGYTVAKVERWNQFARIRQDLFGFIDILAIRTDRTGVLAVQTTTKPFLDDHSQLIKSLANVRTWLEGDNRIWLLGWEKAWKGDGSHRKVWAPIVQEVTLAVNGSKKLYFERCTEVADEGK
jgi:hypothetical protein